MCSDIAIELRGAAKRYRLFDRPADRLLSMLPLLHRRARQRVYHGLHPIDLTIQHGEVVGIIGRNGAGKSTLLQLICQTLPASEGTLTANGKISALLELGAGFNADFSGRENVYLSASILGMSRDEVTRRLDDILAFADIGDFIDQPVKTYSSGMFVRLAFAVATAVDPDILVVDEALSVGDGAFARKSFERIMDMKAAGKTILFCSHSLYQVEAICSRALWIEGGRVVEDGSPDDVIGHYQRFLDTGLMPGELSQPAERSESIQDPSRFETLDDVDAPSAPLPPSATADTPVGEEGSPQGFARLTTTRVAIDGAPGKKLSARSGESELSIEVGFDSDPALPCPTVAVTISTVDGHIVTSAATWEDGVDVDRNAAGQGRARIVYERLALLKGRYVVGVYVFCERGVHSYGWVDPVASLEVSQQGIEKGVCRLPHAWSTEAP